MSSHHNQTAALARVVCPYCKANSPMVSYKCIIRTERVVEKAFQTTQLMGGKKPFLESKRSYLARFYTHIESHYEMIANFPEPEMKLSLIELRCKFPNGTFYWHGNGAAKPTGSDESLSSILQINQGWGNGEGDQTRFQIDITGILNEVAPYLEKR